MKEKKKAEKEEHTHGEPHVGKEERIHISLGRKLDIFYLDPERAQGLPFYAPNGMIIKNELIDYMRGLNKQAGYEEISTPLVFRTSLWKESGHLEAYLGRMYIFEKDKNQYGIKPMNCPGHILLFQRKPWSYKELPVRYSEFGIIHRYEQSGELSGLLRVRALTMDDGHVFAREDQVQNEVRTLLRIVKEIMVNKFHFSDIRYALSMRAKPGEEKEGETYIGDLKVWEKATNDLREALDSEGIKYVEKLGEAAFYGPKIDVDIKDSLGSWWQCSTIQLDFNLPQRFKLYYVDENEKKIMPVMIHRALYGSLDRFIGILLEHYKGVFPAWLSPTQAMVIPISESNFKYAEKIKSRLDEEGVRVSSDLSSNTLEYKIRAAYDQKVPYLLIVGKKRRGEQFSGCQGKRQQDEVRREARPFCGKSEKRDI